MITQKMLRTLWPDAPQAKIEAIAKAAPAIFDRYGLRTQLRVAHLMAQVSHENGAGTIVRENMNYNAPRLLEIFGGGHHSAAVTREEANRLAHHPEAIAERVYGLGNPKKAHELGNTRPGDGWRFRGNGDLQLTGGGSHHHIGELIGVDLYNHPEQLEDPVTSFRCAVAEFVALKCLPSADEDNVLEVTIKVNGGKNGLAERKVWLRKWKQQLATVSKSSASPMVDVAPPDIPPPEEPRGGESDGVASMTHSTIGNGAIAAGGGGVLVAAKGVTDAVKDVPEGVLNAILSALQSPYVLGAALIIAAAGYIWWRRHRMKTEQGV